MSIIDSITITQPDDWHLHLRLGELLQLVLPFTTRVFARAMVMPNTAPRAIVTATDVIWYRTEIESLLAAQSISGFKPLFTFKITPTTTRAMVYAAQEAGVIAGKLYPDSVTTGSAGGVRDFKALYPVFQLMAEFGIVLSIHCELPDAPTTGPKNAEVAFIPVLRDIIAAIPGLRIVVEHVSTEVMVAFVKQAPATVAATITPHHLVLVHNDATTNIHNYCKPVAKTPADREAVVLAAVSGDRRFFLGGDSASHWLVQKQAGAAGVFCAPVALELVTQVFASHGALERLGLFVSHHGADFYGLPRNGGMITLVRQPWQVPAEYRGLNGNVLVPFLAGQTLQWQVAA